jgi:hypothetical protein
MKAPTGHALRTVAFVALTLLTISSRATEAPGPLPDFELKTLDKRPVRSQRLPTKGRWLLVYVEAACVPCEDVFRAFDREQPLSDLPQKVVVVVGGKTAEEVKRMAARFPWLPADCWYADPSREAGAALKAHGVPRVYGVSGDRVEWSLGGTLADHKKLQSILLAWCEGQTVNQPPTPQ